MVFGREVHILRGKTYILHILISIILVISILVCLISLKMNFQSIKIAIYPTAITDESYYFELYKNGKLLCQKGERTEDDIRHNPFIDISEFKEWKVISNTEVDKIYELAKDLNEVNKNEDIIFTDSWRVVVEYKNKVHGEYYTNLTAEMNELLQMLMEISDIEIDLHSW